MRLIFSVLTAIIVILAAVVFIGPLFFSAEDVRNQILTQVESTTGYRIRVSGPVDITLFPSVNLIAEDVGVSQPAVTGEAEFATAKTLKFGLMLRGLLSGKMQVTEITLIDPVIAVPASLAKAPVAAPGVPMAPAPKAPPGAPKAPSANGGAGGIAETLKNLTLDEVVIENGTVILPPSGKTPGKRIEKLNLEASLPAFDEPLSFDVSAVFDGKVIKAKGAVGNFGQFLEGAPARVSLALEAPGTLPDKATMAGVATYKDDTLTLSQFSAKSGDIALAGSAVYKDGTATLSQVTATAGRDTFAGNAVYKDNIVTLKNFRANVRGNVLAGSATINLANKIPYVVAGIAAKTLDINALTGSPKAKPSGGGGAGGSGGGGSKPRQASAGWSNAKIDFSPLRLVNAKINLSAEQLIYDNMKINPVTVQATLNGGKLNATLSKFKLYSGAGDIAIVVDASRKVPAQRVTLSLSNFNAYNLLKDAAGFERIEGRGSLSFDLTTAGVSQRAIVGALNGKADFKFVNGAIRGINIAQMMRNLGSGALNGWQGGASEKTDFASLGASFTVVKGQATTKDFHMSGPLVRLTGEGTINLPAKSVKFRVDPQLVASLKGQGGEKDIAGLGVPIMIVGPWAKPKIYPDIKGILQNPSAAIERFKQFGGDVGNLPGLDKIDKAGALSNVIKDGKLDQGALIEGLGGLFGKKGSADALPSNAKTAPGAKAAPRAAPKAQPKARAKPKAKSKTNAKAKAQPKSKAKSKAKAQPKSKAQPKAQAKGKAKPKATNAAAKKKAAQKAKKAKKKKQKDDAEDAAQQLLDGFLGQ